MTRASGPISAKPLAKLTLVLSTFFCENMENIFALSYHSWTLTHNWTISSSKTKTLLSYMANVLAADDLVMQGARASTSMVMTSFSQNVSPERMKSHAMQKSCIFIQEHGFWIQVFCPWRPTILALWVRSCISQCTCLPLWSINVPYPNWRPSYPFPRVLLSISSLNL